MINAELDVKMKKLIMLQQKKCKNVPFVIYEKHES